MKTDPELKAAAVRGQRQGFMLAGLSMIVGVLLALVLTSCAHVSDYEAAATCPAPMSDAQLSSGRVQCRALCSSYARDMVDFDRDCRCVCSPQRGVHPKSPTPGSTTNTQI